MPWITLAPQAGQQSPLGGNVEFYSPNAPAFAAGDPFMISATGMQPNEGEVGYAVPVSSAWPTYFGNVANDGSLDIIGVAPAAGNLANGILLAIGVLPPGGASPVNPLGYRPVLLVPAAPAPPAPTPGLPLVIADVEASWQNHVAVANWRTDGTTVMYQSQPPYLAAPVVVTMPFMYCLSDAKAAAIAALLGGTVQKLPPTGYYSDIYAINPVTGNIDGTLPAVNWIFATINGVPMKALGMALVQAFDARQGNLQAAILATFQTA